MGNTLPQRLDAKQVSHLKAQTHLSAPQLRSLHKTFGLLSEGKTTITKEQFYRGLKEAGVYSNDPSEKEKLHSRDWRFLESFFDALDRGNTGTINFREFCSGAAVFATGNLANSLEFMFQLYNLAGDDAITEAEMVQAMVSMSTVLELEKFSDVKRDDSWLADGDEVKRWVHEIFVTADKSKTGTLTYKEFYDAVSHHPLLVALADTFVQEVCKDFFKVPDAH